MESISPWLKRAEHKQRPALAEDLEVDVAVIGAGMVGLTSALGLRRSGARVVVLEARDVAGATSANNTAKVSSLQGLAYSRINDEDAAASYARANEDGIELIGSLVSELGIDCFWERTENFTFADDPAQIDLLEHELEASRAAGLATELVSETPLPFEVAGALRLADQAELDPVAFLRGIADELDREQPTVYEGTRVVEVGGDRVIAESGATVRCHRVVVATHLPLVDRIGLFARAEPKASYAIAVRPAVLPAHGMYIDAGGMHSLRRLQGAGEPLLVVAGQGRRLGTGRASESLDALASYARDRFGAGEPLYHWDAHDYVTEDRLPFVGSLHPRSDRLLTATGMNKWGLALGAACGRMLADSIVHGGRRWPAEFDSRRLPRPHRWPTLARNGVETGFHLVGDRLKRADADAIAPGDGAVVGSGLSQVAAYRDEDGGLHRVSARCTHLGCIVAFNDAARTWDCPCHGSRFAVDGSVLEGPATAPLEPRDR